MKKSILIVLFFVIFFQFVNADFMSINSGGDEELVINPDTYIEGFFSGDVQVLSLCGNGTIESPYETCDDGNTISGDGCSSSCVIESGYTCTGEPSVCTLISGEEGGGGGGGGAGGISITVIPTEIDINLAVNTNRERKIYITNTGTSAVSLTVSQQNLTNMVMFSETSFIVAPGEIKELTAIFVGLSRTGIFTGKIFIGGKIIYVSINVATKLLLFDSNIIVLNENYLVKQGDKLKTSVTLVPLGEIDRLDVVLNYVIKDYDGRVYLTRSETVLIENPVNFKRNFDTGILPPGKYVVGLELIYSNGVAPSSAHFEITKRGSTFFGRLVLFLINGVLIILIIIILIIIIRIIKQIIRNKKLEKEALKALQKKEKK